MEGKEAFDFRSSSSVGCRWLSTYILKRWGAKPRDSEYSRLATRVYRSMMLYVKEKSTGQVLDKPGKHVIPDGHRCRVVKPKERVRIASVTRQVNNTLMPELQEELFQWWVDLSQVLQARVATSIIIAEAELMVRDLVDAGVVNPRRIPRITRMWIARWRHFYGLVPRCITCTYKVSYYKKLQRQGLLWRNAVRLLVFHALLFGPGLLTFLSMDEKPYRFNCSGDDRVWARRGQKYVKAKEKRAQLLQRWTWITAVWSRLHASLATGANGQWMTKGGALFKGVDGSRTEVESPSQRCQILYAPNGSITSETWMQWLGHILPVVVHAVNAIVPVTDWYGPHMTEDAFDFAERQVLSPTLLIGGGATEMSVCDNNPHRFLAKRYKELEQVANLQKLTARPDQVPTATKQDVLDRGWQAWCDFDQNSGFDLHKALGYTTAVDGSEEHLIAEDAKHFWDVLEMRVVRQQLAAEVRQLNDQGVITNWNDAKDLVEVHANHRIMYEGEEDAAIQEGDEDSSDDGEPGDEGEGDSDDDDGNQGGGLTTYKKGEEGGNEGGEGDGSGGEEQASEPDAPGGGGSGGPATDTADGRSLTGVFGGGLTTYASDECKETCHEEAVRTLSEQSNTSKQQLLENIARLAAEAGEPSLARDVQDRLRKLRKTTQIANTDVAVIVRTQRLERHRRVLDFREKTKAEDGQRREMEARAKLLQRENEAAAIRARENASEAKLLETKRKTDAARATAKAAILANENRDIRRVYAAEVVNLLKAVSREQRLIMAAAVKKRLKCAQPNGSHLPRHLPRCWPDMKHKQDLRRLDGETAKGAELVFASEAFTFVLYGGQPKAIHPLHAAPAFRLKHFLDPLLPGWEELFKPKWSALDLIQASGYVADAAFLNLVHMYKRVLGNSFPRGVFEWWPTEWLKSYRQRKAIAAKQNKDTPVHDEGRSHAVANLPVPGGALIENHGRGLPSNCAQAKLELAARRRRPQTSETQSVGLGSGDGAKQARPDSGKKRRIGSKDTKPSQYMTQAERMALDTQP